MFMDTTSVTPKYPDIEPHQPLILSHYQSNGFRDSASVSHDAIAMFVFTNQEYHLSYYRAPSLILTSTNMFTYMTLDS
jgi:hypothetical protein